MIQTDIVYEISKLLGKSWAAAGDEKTVKAKEERRARIGESLMAQGLQTVRSIRPRHVEEYLKQINKEHMAGKGRGKPMAPGSYAPHLTELRAIARAVGKENIMHRDNAYYAGARTRNNPLTLNGDHYAKALDKLADNKHSREFLVAKTSGDILGLRFREQLYTKDVVIKLDDGRFLASAKSGRELFEVTHETLVNRYKSGIGRYLDRAKVGVLSAVIEGAKGGQRRLVLLDTPEKLAAMELRMAHIRDNGLRSMMPVGLEAKAAEKAYKNALNRAGFTRGNGCNPHAARHHWAQQEKASGKSAWEISESLGHHRLSVLSAYIKK
jgi:site-specific recombinase XerD